MNKREYVVMSELEDSHFWFAGKRFFIDVFLSPYKKRIKNILDLGSGTGGATQFLERYGNVIGIEKSRLAVSLAKKRGLNILTTSLENIPFKKPKFDLITLLDVLYHKDVKSEDKVLKKAHSILNKRGLVLITDSAFDFLKSSHDRFTQGKRRYSRLQMESILERNGFKPIRSSYIFMTLFPVVALKRIFIDKLVHHKSSDVEETTEPVNHFLKFILKSESHLLRKTNLPFGTSVIILAEKE